MQLTPTIYLPGLVDEAIAFYRTALDIDIQFIRRIEDCIDPRFIQPGTERKVLRAALRIGQSVFHLSDGHGTRVPQHDGFSLSLAFPTLPEAERAIDALSEGGRVLLPLRQTTWANMYGAVIDRFGLHWTVETGGII